MKKSFLFSAARMPSDLGNDMPRALDSSLRDIENSGLSAPDLKSQLYDDVDDLTSLDKPVLEEQKLTYNASHLPREHKHLMRWAERRILRDDDDVARQCIADRLGIVDLEETTLALAELNAFDPELVTDLLEGRLRSAIARIPATGYPEAGWACDDALAIVEAVGRLWIANDLQLEAAAAHVRLFRPTGLSLLDSKSKAQPPRQGGVALIIERDLELFEEAARLYYREQNGTEPPAERKPCNHTAALLTGGASLSVTWPSAQFATFGPDITEAEAKPFCDPLLKSTAKMMLIAWRAKHGDQLEEYVRRRMDQARAELAKLRRELDSIRSCNSRRGQRACNLHGVYPLVRLWLACERAIAWTGAISASRNENPEEGRDFIEQAVRHVQRGAAVSRPRIRKHHVTDARQLFFALRCLIVKDPGHLPTTMLHVTLPSGQVAEATTREQAEMLRGAPFTFAEIWNHQIARMGPRNSREIFSHPFTIRTNSFLKDHEARPTEQSRHTLAHAWGTIAWRLQQ